MKNSWTLKTVYGKHFFVLSDFLKKNLSDELETFLLPVSCLEYLQFFMEIAIISSEVFRSREVYLINTVLNIFNSSNKLYAKN